LQKLEAAIQERSEALARIAHHEVVVQDLQIKLEEKELEFQE